ncbi:MAG: manganese-dependent inorganic pyrophosphatase [Paracoccaceae bacterium]|nr:manganese-dependent inorganic pyrophosphatase [Paracoccaceae bacterium]MDE2916802.1 manganese-dependent inorganic pyrophosphatase [Paracoccaceae bacterium]
MIKVLGHKSPDTDSTGSPIVWSWYLNECRNKNSKAVLQGDPNNEAKFVLDYWGLELPEIIEDLFDGEDVVIVDTNNVSELPENIGNANIIGLIDHHLLQGGLSTSTPIEITIRPLACTATIMLDLMGSEVVARMPRSIKGVALSCIISDTLEFRSPTTTDHDRKVAEDLAKDLDINISNYAAEMFAAKSDVSMFTDNQLIMIDSKRYDLQGKKLRISVLETTTPSQVLDRTSSLLESLNAGAENENIDVVLMFVVDILNGNSTLFVPNEMVRTIAKSSFGVEGSGNTLVLPGIVSRKKQIIPNLKL